MTNNKTEGVEDLATEFQKECHKAVASILRNTDITSYQDATNVWLFRKLAELQLEIDQLKANQIINPYELK